MICAVCKEFGINPAWLLLGEGVKYSSEASGLAARAYRVTRNFTKENPIDWNDELEEQFFMLSFRYLTEHSNSSDEFLDFTLKRMLVNGR